MSKLNKLMPEFERIDGEVKSFECCSQCEEPKFPHDQEAGGEKEFGWPGCVNPQCIAFGEQQCSAAYRTPTEVALNLQTRLNALRSWIQEQGYEFTFEAIK